MIVRDKYQIVISPETALDLADLSDAEMEQIKKLAQEILLNGDTKSVIMAYFAAFTCYVMDLQLLSEEYDPKKHLSH